MGGASKQFHAKKKKLEKQAAEDKNNEKSKVTFQCCFVYF
jgi:hypothetical protein